jgi:hypothetical protein
MNRIKSCKSLLGLAPTAAHLETIIQHGVARPLTFRSYGLDLGLYLPALPSWVQALSVTDAGTILLVEYSLSSSASQRKYSVL